MKKLLFAISIVALFIGVSSIPAGANVDVEAPENGRPNWKYLVIGRIKSYKIEEYNGTEYLNCTAVRVKIRTWNIFERFPRLMLSMKVRYGQEFYIPYEGAKIIGPIILGHYFIIARGSLQL